MTMQNKRLAGIMIAAACILLIPFIAMQFNSGVDWNALDFGIAGVLLFGTGLLIEVVLRNVKSKDFRIALCLLILAGLFLIWAELAVGIFGTPFAGS